MPDNIIRPAAFHRPDPDDPPNPDPAAPAAIPSFRRREYSLFEVARRLGIGERSTATIIRHVRDLIDLRGLPAPLGVRIVRGRDEAGREKSTVLEGAAAVHLRSMWNADLFDAWSRQRLSALDRQLADRAERSQAQIALDRAADRLFDAPRKAAS